MKKIQKIYYILTYLFFIYPPFIFGLVEIYQESGTIDTYIISGIINLILIVVLASVCAVLIYYKKLHIPSTLEIKYLVFGFIGNIVVYFYTFQNEMYIDNIVTTYLVLLIILAVHLFLISKKIQVKELWILLPIFLVVDYIHLLVTGCGFTSPDICYYNFGTPWYIDTLYFLFVIPIIGYYGYKIYLYKPRSILKYMNIILVVVMSFILQDVDAFNEKFQLTIGITLPFLTIVDFVVGIINKTYTHKTLLFYIRTYTLLLIFGMLGSFEFFYGNADFRILTIMVMITYVSLGISILKVILNISIEDIGSSLSKDITFLICSNEYIKTIKETYGDIAADHMNLEDNAYSLVTVKDDQVIGFISTYIQSLPVPLESVNEAYINIIEVHKDYRNQGIGTTLTLRTEKHFKQLGITQIRGWSSDDKLEAIQLWHKLNYQLSPATIWIEKDKVSVTGYYFIKTL